MEDIEDAVQPAYESGSIMEEVYRKCINNRSVKRVILELYNKIYSCDTAYNGTMKEAVMHVVQGIEN